jgi:phosphate transport system permease protein
VTTTSPYLPTADFARWRKVKSSAITGILVLCALAVIAPLFLVIYFLVSRGASSLDWSFFTQLPKPTGEAGGGMANAIVGTIMLLAMARIARTAGFALRLTC